MYNSQYYTCEQIDERLLQGYLDDYNTQTGQSLTKAQFLTKLGSIFSKEGVIDNTATQIGYYECDTAAGTAAKTITVANYALFAGGSMKVKFANKNTANNATLNINSQGAKALYYQGERASATNSWDANEVVEIYYDGTSYYANNVKGGSGSGVYDVSKEHPTSGPNSDGKFTLEYILNSSNVNELIPVNKRYPGMTIQFVSTSDNKYVQFRYRSSSTSAADYTNVENWQGVDSAPIAGSKSLSESGGVRNVFNDIIGIMADKSISVTGTSTTTTGISLKSGVKYAIYVQCSTAITNKNTGIWVLNESSQFTKISQLTSEQFDDGYIMEYTPVEDVTLWVRPYDTGTVAVKVWDETIPVTLNSLNKRTALQNFLLSEEYSENGNITYDTNGAVSTYPVKWSDGTAGVYTATDWDNSNQMYKGYEVTYGTTHKVVQPAVTVADFKITNVPTKQVVAL